MSNPMAGVIAAHKEHAVKLDHDCYLSVCTGCQWRKRHSGDSDHAAHVAEELGKAGYGKLADAWDEGFCDGERQSAEGDGGPKFTNPYREAHPSKS